MVSSCFPNDSSHRRGSVAILAQVPQQASGGPRRPTGASWNVDGDASIGGRRLRPTVGVHFTLTMMNSPTVGVYRLRGLFPIQQRPPFRGRWLVGVREGAKERRGEEAQKRRSEEDNKRRCEEERWRRVTFALDRTRLCTVGVAKLSAS